MNNATKHVCLLQSELYSKSRTVRAEETTFRDIKETFQDKKASLLTKEDIFGILLDAVLINSIRII